MQLPLFQVDAFAKEVFEGNPAAVVLLDQDLPDALLQAIAAENNLSETAFVSVGPEPVPLRWFTPRLEVDLCGHATLASAFVLFSNGLVDGDRVEFETKSGKLTVEKRGELLRMSFPARPPKPIAITRELEEALGVRPKEVHSSRDWLVLLESEEQVASLKPDFARIEALETFAVIVTAVGREVDFVSRFFVPKAGIQEDPVTGSAHCTLIPFWADRLGKSVMKARQLSSRGGELYCENRGDRVVIGGGAVEYLRGMIRVTSRQACK